MRQKARYPSGFFAVSYQNYESIPPEVKSILTKSSFSLEKIMQSSRGSIHVIMEQSYKVSDIPTCSPYIKHYRS
jgi:hypothetical protein